MNKLTPITRIEQFLDGIVNGSEVPDPALARVEIFLNAIKNNEVCALTPITREEMFLAKISGANVVTPTPVTRNEIFLAKIAGADVETPEPVTRIEYWLDEWANGGVVPEYATVSGAIASFETVRSAPLRRLEVEIEPVQEGSGNPSPDNVRPISGRTGANVWVEPTYDTSKQPKVSANWQTETGTVYGGTLDVVSGVLTVDRGILDFSTLDFASYSTPSRHVFRCGIPPEMYSPPSTENAKLTSAICEQYYPMVYNPISANDNGAFAVGNSKITVIDHRFTDVPSFATATSEVKLCFELATSITYQLAPTQVQALLGQNNIWSDVGSVTVEYQSN